MKRAHKTSRIVLLGLTALLAFGDLAATDRIVTAVPCENVRVIDGDTVRCSLVCPFGLTIRDRVLRAANYDAWESSRARRTVNVTDVEVVRGREATAALEGLIGQGTLFAEDTGRADAYGRLLAILYVRRGGEFIDVADWMESHHHLREPRQR